MKFISIQDSNNRSNFISNLYKLMKTIQIDVQLDFENILMKFLEVIQSFEEYDFKELLRKTIFQENFQVMKSFLIWGSEMNYIADIITNPKSNISRKEIMKFFDDKDYKEAFILTSVYNLINKTFFIRILEDTSTKFTTFIEGIKNNRYLSNGILQDKIQEGEKSFIQYIKEVYEFSKKDLKSFSFLLKKDIYSWVIEWIDAVNLIAFIRLFNDLSFKKLNQDILGDIYEHYLEQDTNNDEKSFRRLLGQYYTPKPIVRFMWKLTREVIKEIYKRDLYQENKNYLDILDPAYGSGTFLYEAILQINQSAVGKQITKDGKVWGFIKNRETNFIIENSLFGFEINPLSKSIADVNLFFGLIQGYGIDVLNKTPVKHLNIFRTDSLDLEIKNDIEDQLLFSYPYMVNDLKYSLQEKNEIIDAKKKKYDVIISNPPYGHVTPTEYMKKHILPFAYAVNNYDERGNEISFSWDNIINSGEIPEDEKNRGKLSDFYAFFMGVADKLIKDNGIICYITANTYLSIPTYKWLRKYFLENYLIHYIINFNNISDRLSLFLPEASIATSIIVMSKRKNKIKDHKIKILDLSSIDSIIEKYESFADIEWFNNPKNKNDIKSFIIKPIDELPFIQIEQKYFLHKRDYVLRISIYENIISKIENNSNPISNYGELFCGIDVGDLKHLVGETKNDIRNKIENYVFSRKLDTFNKTSKEYITNNLHNSLIKTKFDEGKVIPFVFQKDIEKYYYKKIYYTYMDHYILWRSRTQERNKPKFEIFEKNKLLILERRESSSIYSLVTDSTIAPQHGGRFNYLIKSQQISTDDLYLICAILNSKLLNFYYKYQAQGEKNILIKDINNISFKIKEKIVLLSKELHKLKSDKVKFQENNNNFKSRWFNNKIEPYMKIISILENTDLWKLSFSSEMIQDFYVLNPKINKNNKNEIILNEESQIICKNSEIANKLFKKYLKNYDGNLSHHEILINLIEFQNPKLFNNLLISIENEIIRLENEVDDLVFEIYNISEEEKRNILNNL